MPTPLAARDRLIVALEVSKGEEAIRLAASLSHSVSTFKVGHQLFTAEGPQLVRKLAGANRQVFLDLKFHDIPTIVAGAVRSAAALGVKMLTVHAAGGSRMLKAAMDAWQGANRPLVLAVTVLTSLKEEDLDEIGVSGRALDHTERLADQTLRLAALAQASGCDGVIASPHEAAVLRRELGSSFLIVTPGIRPAGAPMADQSRAATPAEAIAAGADYLVVGRPVTESRNPARAAADMVVEIAAAAGEGKTETSAVGR